MKRYNPALFSPWHFAYTTHYQCFTFINTVTPLPYRCLHFSCLFQMDGVTLQTIRVSFNSDFDSVSSTRRDDACCFLVTAGRCWCPSMPPTRTMTSTRCLISGNRWDGTPNTCLHLRSVWRIISVTPSHTDWMVRSTRLRNSSRRSSLRCK